VRLHLLLLHLPDKTFTQLQLEVRWLYNDWMLYAPPAADWSRATTPASNAARYVLFWG